MHNHLLVLKLDCPDGVGLLARITGFIAAHGGNLAEVHQYTDAMAKWFFARLVFEPAAGTNCQSLKNEFREVADSIAANWTLRDSGIRPRMAVFVSREDHCLAELLWRVRSAELPVEIAFVLGNHPNCRELAAAEGIPFIEIPMPPDQREAAFEAMAGHCATHALDLVVLARFMQVLPPWFCDRYAGRIINIHHSFLPAFAGADPYRRAFERGVKLIGATCHYATAELDAGPIIEQEVVRVEHFHEIEDLKRHGRDCERLALARGVRFHVEDRVLVHGPRTIVFRD